MDRARLAKLTSQYIIDDAATKDNPHNGSNWKHALVCCGSNAFNQLGPDLGELMMPTLKHFPHHSLDNDHIEILHIACSGNNTAMIVADEVMEKQDGTKACRGWLFMWGNGRSSSQSRVPVSLPTKSTIVSLSCGHNHAGFVTELGYAFTWGSGEHGMLGHGSKTSVTTPKRIDSMKQLFCSDISCGAFHTAIIACEKEGKSYIRLPLSPQRQKYHDQISGTGFAGESISSSEEYATGGCLYMCGLGKAGQLGVGANRLPQRGGLQGTLPKPMIVPFFEENGLRVIKVSCGFHHTLVIAVPAQALRVFSPSLYAFGYGECGRLGLGDEEQQHVPVQVQFPVPFHPTQISAGEQHSVAVGREGCYAWGSNDHGQLGTGNPAQLEFSLLPMKIALPEGMEVRKLVAGGRHTAGTTYCGNILSWGWGEEGQLGHGTENSTYLPKPCKLPDVHGQLSSTPMDVALGSTHSFLVMHNPYYVTPTPQPVKEKAGEDTPETVLAEPSPPPSPAAEPPEPEPQVTSPVPEPVIEVVEPVEHKPPTIVLDSEDMALSPVPSSTVAEKEEEAKAITPAPPPPAVVVGIKELLQQREERKAARSTLVQVEIKPEPQPEPEPEPVVVTPVVEDPVPLQPEPEPIVAEEEEEEEEEQAELPLLVDAEPKVEEEPLQMPFYHSMKRVCPA